MALTLRSINSHKPKASRYVIWDGGVSGFGLRVTPSGERTYVLKYRTRDGRQRWFTIGRHGSPWTPELARREAHRLLGEIADGNDPVATKLGHRATVTVGLLAERYLADHAEDKKKASSIRMDKINLSKHILPALGKRSLNEIDRADVARFHSSMRKTPGAANRCLALLSKMMNLAEAWGIRPDGSNPCRHIQKYPEHPRKRYLSYGVLCKEGAPINFKSGVAACLLYRRERTFAVQNGMSALGPKPRLGGATLNAINRLSRQPELDPRFAAPPLRSAWRHRQRI
jgi:hypothetical protein